MTVKNDLWATPLEIDIGLGSGVDVAAAARRLGTAAAYNITEKRPYLELMIQAAAVTISPFLYQTIEAYLLATDAYEQGYDGGDVATDPLIAPVAVMALYAKSGAQFAFFNQIVVPPRSFKILLINRATVAMNILARGYLCNRTLG